MREYLSVRHRDDPENGCPSAALLDEISRCADATKQVYTDGVLAFIDDFAARLAPHDPPSARAKALSIYAAMVGTMQMSRALADRQLADEILEQGIRNVLTLIHADRRRRRLGLRVERELTPGRCRWPAVAAAIAAVTAGHRHRVYQGSGPSALWNPPVGPPSSSSARRTMCSAAWAGVRMPVLPLISVST